MQLYTTAGVRKVHQSLVFCILFGLTLRTHFCQRSCNDEDCQTPGFLISTSSVPSAALHADSNTNQTVPQQAYPAPVAPAGLTAGDTLMCQ